MNTWKRIDHLLRAVPLAFRISFVLAMARVSILGMATLFWIFLSATGGTPALFDKYGATAHVVLRDDGQRRSNR